MESSDNLYLLFAAGKYYFFAPVSWVQRVADGSVQEKDLLSAEGHYDAGCPKEDTISLSGEETVTGHRYRVYLEKAEIRLGIAADKVVEIKNLEEEQMLPLGLPVINEGNRFLKAAVPMKLEEEQIMAYVLEPVYLAGKK